MIQLKLAICDDDILCCEQLLSIVTEYITQNGRDISASVYHNAVDLAEDVLRFGGFDIYLLDIIMPEIDGIKLGMELRQHDPEGKILYLSSSQEYAIDSFKARPFDYILKPIQKDRIFAALDDAVDSIVNRRKKSLIVKCRENNIRLTFDSIMYVELINRKIAYYTAGGNVIQGNSIRTTFAKSIQELLEDGRFVLCGSSLAVNLYYITMVDNDTLFFKNGGKLYIGKRSCRDLRSVWSDFWINREGSK